MKPNDRLIRKYLRQVRELLPCGRKERRRILQTLRANVTDFLAETSNVSVRDIEQRFGTPQSIAASYLDSEDRNVVLKKLQTRRTVKRIIVACAAVVILLWGAFIGWAAYEEWNFANGYIVDEISEIPH